MTALDLLQELQKRPFTPIRLHISNGSAYDLRHPEQCIVGMDSVVVGVAADPTALLFERLIRIDNSHIVKVEPIHGMIAGSPSG